ncbi:hypothetical protein JZ751_018048 [Albula glossodonta]|uniref:EF-hand domain-containing protein n=1 Tax=Albula glossodonta TaxID=121402 RepID=A0A8T2PQ08_9TELE|nr:hypothetical protein JZ751_018048 [Albula glossodonta]
MSDLEKSMIAIILVFHKYSNQKCTLRKAELKDLINNEMGQFIMEDWFSWGVGVCDSPLWGGLSMSATPSWHHWTYFKKIQENETLDQLFADLDLNKDLAIDFQEFIAMIAMVTSACHDLFVPGHEDHTRTN